MLLMFATSGCFIHRSKFLTFSLLLSVNGHECQAWCNYMQCNVDTHLKYCSCIEWCARSNAADCLWNSAACKNLGWNFKWPLLVYIRRDVVINSPVADQRSSYVVKLPGGGRETSTYSVVDKAKCSLMGKWKNFVLIFTFFEHKKPSQYEYKLTLKWKSWSVWILLWRM